MAELKKTEMLEVQGTLGAYKYPKSFAFAFQSDGEEGVRYLSFKEIFGEVNKFKEGDWVAVSGTRSMGVSKELGVTLYVKKVHKHKKGEEGKQAEKVPEIVVESGRGAMEQKPSLLATGTEAKGLVPRGAVSIKEMGEIIDEINAFLSKKLKKDEDYGVIPGTIKPTLLKPGAEKIVRFFGLIPHPIETKRADEWEKPFFMREYVCELRTPSGLVVAYGVGACNSYEKHYYDRDRKTYRGDPYFLHNTVAKMALKRALVCATMTLPGVSVQFTQDMEDLKE